MSRKQARQAGWARALAAVMLLANLLLAACGSSAGVATPTAIAVNDDVLETATPAPVSAYDKIRAAEKAGTLNRSTAWLYRAESVLNPSAVPSDYQDPNASGLWSRVKSAGRAAREAVAAKVQQAVNALRSAGKHWKELSAELQAKFLPYRTRPTESSSFWYQTFVAPSSGRVPGLGAPATAATQFAYVDVARTPVRMWYIKSRSEDADLARKLADEIDSSQMWQKEQAVMLNHTPCSDPGLSTNGGDGRFDVYLVPPGKGPSRKDSGGDSAKMPGDESDSYSILGITIPQDTDGACPSRDFILMNTDQEWDSLRSTMAHELFHAFQDSFQQPDDSYYWFDEASATWAEDYIYPELDDEHGQLESGNWAKVSGVIGPLDLFDDEGLAQYGAYIWPFYLTHRPGGDPRLIGQFFQAGETKPFIEVFHDLPGWNDRFKEFALWNWNQDPVQMYRDHGQPIAELVQTPRRFGVHRNIALENGEAGARVDLPATSLIYYELGSIDDSGGFVHSISFNLEAIQGDDGLGIQAIIYTPTGSRVEDWSNQSAKVFCRDRANEKISNVVLVLTNSTIETDTHIKGRIFVTPSGNRCS
jgi:hypothetical protein